MNKNSTKFKKLFIAMFVANIIFSVFLLTFLATAKTANAQDQIQCDELADPRCVCTDYDDISGTGTVCYIANSEEEADVARDIAKTTAGKEKGVSSDKVNAEDGSTPGSCDWLNVICNIVIGIEWLINYLIEFSFRIANFLFTYMVNLNRTSFGGQGTHGILIAGSIGWRVTRDVANMFFVFFLLWIAIATIFGFEQYSARQLLPKLIITALLINFSLPMAQLVIDSSNALADVFIQGLGEGNLAKPFQSLGINPQATTKKIGTLTNPAAAATTPDKREIAETLVRNTNVTLVGDDGSVITYQRGECETRPGFFGQPWVQRLLYGNLCSGAIAMQVASDWGVANINSGDMGWTFTQAALRRIAIKIIVAPVALFVIFAAVFMLIARLIHLTFIVVLGPLAFLFMILPATQRYYQQWWDSLIKWSFFFPAFMFFFWLGVNVLSALAAGKSASMPDMMVSLFVGVGFLIGSLIVSQQLGVAVAGTALNMGKRWTTGIRRAATRGGLRLGARAAGAAAKPAMETRAMQWLASKPIIRGLTKPFEAATRAKEGVEQERARALQQAMKASPPDYAAARFKGERAKVQEAYLKGAGEQDIQKLEKGLGKQEMSKVGLQMAAISPGLEKRIASAVKNDEVKASLNKKIDINSPDFDRAYKEFMDEQTVGQLREIARPDNIRESERLQKYLLERGGEKEIEALTKNGEQLLALREVFERWTNEAYNNPASNAGQGMRDMVAYLQSGGATRANAEAETERRMRAGDFLESVLEEKGANNEVQQWARNAPMIRVVIGEGRILGRRGEDFEDLLKRLNISGGGAAPPTGGTAPTGGTTP